MIQIDTSVYPQTYGVSLGWKLFLLPFGVVFGLGGIAGVVAAVAFYPPHDVNAPIGAVLLSVISAGFAGLGIYSVLSALMYRVVLTAEGIEVSGPFRRNSLLCREIRGRRIIRNHQGPSTLSWCHESARPVRSRFP